MLSSPWLAVSRIHSSLVLALIILDSVQACTTSNFDPIYDPYPLCAQSCLGCKDTDYLTNFENNCDYASGDCCSSLQHDSITATWDCVATTCGGATAQEAFDTFVRFCADKNQPLAEADVPPGYTVNVSTNSTTNGTNTDGGGGGGGGGGLSTEVIIGIAIGIPSALATIIGTYYGWKAWRRRHAQTTTNGPYSNTNGHQLASFGQQVLQGLPSGVLPRGFAVSDTQISLPGYYRRVIQVTGPDSRPSWWRLGKGQQVPEIQQGRILGEL
ncbi:hypothetical protein GGR57DRAFT_448716 [Xylariaceae sp. FL1272]|nr:hypothetical protein GGR57DRAFT_448716 [Xylariaceae sp. FL1272]